MSTIQEGLTTGKDKPPPKKTGVKDYICDFAALPTQVYWLLLLGEPPPPPPDPPLVLPPKPRVHTRPVAEVLNSYRKYGLSSARYQFMTNEWGLCNEGGPHGPEIPGCDTVTQPPLTIKDAPHCRAIVPAWPAAAGSTARPTMAALAVQDVETGWLIGASGTVSIVASIVGSMVTDAIGVCTLVCNIARAPKPNRSTVFVQGLCTSALYKGFVQRAQP